MREATSLGGDPSAQQRAGRRAGAAAILERDLAVHECPAVALGALHEAPLPAGKVVDDLRVPPLGDAREPVELVDDHVIYNPGIGPFGFSPDQLESVIRDYIGLG